MTDAEIIGAAVELDDDFFRRYDRWTREHKATWAEVKDMWLREATEIVERAIAAQQKEAGGE